MYFAAGILAAMMSLSTSAVAVSVGGSGAIFGIYGLLSASVIWGAIANPDVPIPVTTVNRVVAPGAAFVLYNLANDSVGIASAVEGFAANSWAASFLGARSDPVTGRQHDAVWW